MKPLVFQGYRFLRQRLLLSILSGRPIKIEKIRSDQSEPGLKDYEVSLLRLLETVTNGTVIEISYTGTTIAFRPGFIAGSPSAVIQVHKHECPLSIPIGYFLEPLLLLAAFGKAPTNIMLTGITAGSSEYPSVDLLRVGLLPVLKRFGIEDYELRILKRGSSPLGGGQIHFISPGKPPLYHLPTLHFTVPQRITAIRGIATSTKLPAQMTTRLATAARNVLTSCLPPSRIQIYSDPARGNTGSPGYGICLVAETSTGALYTAERVSPETPTEETTPEDIAEQCAQALLLEIAHGGCIDSFAASMVTICCAALNGNKGDVGRVSLGYGCVENENWIQTVRDLKLFFGVEGRFEQQQDGNASGLLCKWVGTGWVNSARGTK